MLIWLFGDVKYSEMHLSDPRKMGGYIELAKAKVRWFLSVDCKDLPPEAVKAGRPTYRSITMENKSHLNCFVHESAYVDDNVKIQNNVSVYEGTTIEDDVFLGPSCVLTNVLNPRSQVRRKALIEVKSRSSMESQTNDINMGCQSLTQIVYLWAINYVQTGKFVPDLPGQRKWESLFEKNHHFGFIISILSWFLFC